MKYEDIRRQVLTAHPAGPAAQGLIHGTSGNISVRDREAGVAAITPSGRPYDTMEPGDIAIVTLDGEWVDGPYAPSSETPMAHGGFTAPAPTWGRWCITTPCSAP